METKKRPNEDPLEPEAKSSTGQAIDPANPVVEDASQAIPITMEVDAASFSPSLIPVTSVPVENAPLPNEANKRLKLTMEADISGADYSPSTDLADPSKETAGLTEWVEQINEDNKTKEDAFGLGVKEDMPSSEIKIADSTTQGPESPSKSAQNPGSSAPKSGVKSPDVERSTVQSASRTPPAVDVRPSTAELTDSILAVASLSEPLLTTLEALEGESQPSIDELTSNPLQKATTSTLNPQISPTSTDSEFASGHLDSASGRADSTEHHTQPLTPAPTSADKAVELHHESSAEIPSQQDDYREPSLKDGEQDHVQRPESQQPPHEDSIAIDAVASASATPHRESSMENHASEDVIMALPRLNTGGESATGVVHDTKNGLRDISGVSSLSVNHDGPATVVQKVGPNPDTVRPPQTPSPATLQQSSSAPISVPRSPSSDSNPGTGRPPSTSSLPRVGSLPAAQPFPETTQSTRPSRSTMSVSALLVSNDYDHEQEQERAKRLSRSIFDQFEAPRPKQMSSPTPPASQQPHHSPPQPAQALQSSLHVAAAPSAPPMSHPGGPHMPSSTSPRSLSSASNVHRSREMTGVYTANPVNVGFNRTAIDSSQLSERVHDAAAPGHGTARANPNKEYMADEVMESGGVSGYGSQRHRLASPVGIRPMQDSVNGATGLGTGLGSGPQNGKLPGLGSVAGMPPGHLHDPHGHPGPSYRGDNNIHSSMMSGRPHSYSPSQHTSLAHPVGANGHHHPILTHAVHNSGMTPRETYSLPASLHPRLIIKNDPSLKMEGCPELFLGYYRYDPSLLLPAMQGKENSLLEVRVASSYLTYDNTKVKRRELWGTDIYTDDSDIVAILIHGGYFIPPLNANSTEDDSIQPSGQQHNFAAEPIKHICPSYDLAVTLRVLPKLIKYQGSIRHRISSRTWNTGHDGVSFKIESIRKMCSGEALNRGRSQSKRRMKEYSQERLRVLANIHDETTESVQNERAMRTATFEFTHQGDPCFKYSPELVMDRHDGLSRKWTSWRLKKEVMILENDEERYEISLQHQAGTDDRRFDLYRFAVISPRTSLSSWSKANYPLDSVDLTEVLYENLDWQDFEWVERGVVVQPSQRAKQNAQDSNYSLMEGVEPTAGTAKDKTPNSATEGMGAVGGNAKDRDRDGIRKTGTGTVEGAAPIGSASSARSMSAGSQDIQQDGVFCVVSRLFWRPITEPRLTKANAWPTYSASGNPSSDVEQTQPVGTQLRPVGVVGGAEGLKNTAPSLTVTHLATGIPQEQAESNTEMKLQASNTQGTPSALPPGGAGDVKRPVQQPGVDSLDGRDPAHAPGSAAVPSHQPAAPLSTSASSVQSTHAPPSGAEFMDVDTPASKHASVESVQKAKSSSVQVQGTAIISEQGHAEREEGELEEGEIASD